MSTIKMTTDHTAIQEWAEKNNGTPQLIDDPSFTGDIPSVRIDFPVRIDDSFLSESMLRDVTWEVFFARFEQEQLAFIYRDDVDLKDPESVYKAYRFIKRDALDELAEQERDLFLERFMTSP